MPANIDSMFSVREVPWHEVGVILDDHPSGIVDALHKSGLDWAVETRPLYTEDIMGIHVDVPQFKVVMRTDTETPLGIVGNRYKPVQNVQAFEFLDGLLGTDLLFETAGSLGQGERIWVLSRIPDDLQVGGDYINRYVLFANSHDGKSAISVLVTPIRVVCQNTLGLALSRKEKNKIQIRHTGDPMMRLNEAKRALGFAEDYYDEFKVMGDQLASTRLTDYKLGKVVEELWPAETDRAKQNQDEIKEAILYLHTKGDTIGNSPGTKWSGLNAICEYLDHYRPTRGDSDRFARINFEATNPKQKAYDLILNI